MPITKPTVQRPWADTGTKTAPSDGRRSTGYVLNDVPTRAELNYLLNELTTLERYVMKVGVSDWDAAETYGIGDITRDPTTLLHYKLEVSGPTGDRPGLDPAHWILHMVNRYPKSTVYSEEITAWLNARLRRRFGIDHMGFPGGQFSGWTEDWSDVAFGTHTATPSSGDYGGRWRFSLTGGGAPSVSTPTPDSTFRTCRHPLLTTASGATLNSAMIQTTPLLSNSDDYSWCWQADVQVVSGEIVHNQATVGVAGASLEGVAGSTIGGGGVVGLHFECGAGDTNWFVGYKVTGSTSMIDSGVAADNGIHRMRIEFYPVNQADDSTARVLFYIDGTLVRNVAHSFTADDFALRPYARVALVSGTATTPLVLITGITSWRHNTWAGDVFI